MGYVERVAHNLKGLKFVSTGVCSGCDECREAFGGYEAREVSDDKWTFEEAGEGIAWRTEAEADAAAREAFEVAWSNGDVYSEGSFSRSGCGICGSALGGTLECWHGVDAEDRILHFDDACVDCVMYLANGDVPERD